jgi:hypothetical protein
VGGVDLVDEAHEGQIPASMHLMQNEKKNIMLIISMIWTNKGSLINLNWVESQWLEKSDFLEPIINILVKK